MNLAWLVPAVLAPGAVLAVRSLWRERRHIPAAPDNQRGIDIDALWTCRRINALPTASRKEDIS
ncbi:hypothetical protein [Streptomyces resistomycificus]|uniref:Uncharacterized protein n=1 Tax=Streptomyces resistomycificus TaxID=67356 RepID=A0A0L8L596_9ACTN|nr:hypothetical protein [Streptomyces resistomycificus]KOG33327.1 hypothetical protein ADK37_23400 [Streptomyces resistomycificus]KUN99534.1 hypothetical protein AQJ84_11340 [Streptomyces resistomycificus]